MRTARFGLAGAGPGQSVPLTIRFLIELALLAVLAWAGAGAHLALAGRIVLAVATAVFAVIAMGVAVLLRVVSPGA